MVQAPSEIFPEVFTTANIPDDRNWAIQGAKPMSNEPGPWDRQRASPPPPPETKPPTARARRLLWLLLAAAIGGLVLALARAFPDANLSGGD